MRPSNIYWVFFILNIIIFLTAFFFLGDILRLIKGLDPGLLETDRYQNLKSRQIITPLLFPASLMILCFSAVILFWTRRSKKQIHPRHYVMLFLVNATIFSMMVISTLMYASYDQRIFDQHVQVFTDTVYR